MSTSEQDPFTGTWVFSGARSALSTPMPQSWVLQIRASGSDVSHREEIIASDGSEMTVVLHATFDGEDHAVSGSPLMDAIACTRPAPHVIASTGKKAGAVTLTDTLTASPDGEALTLTYSIFEGSQEVAQGTGIFERRRAEAMTRTWPEDWDARKQGAGCWFCGNNLGKPFYAGSAGDAHLERHAITRGHAIVVFRDRHVADFTSLTTEEVSAYWRDIHTVAKMIEHVFAPCHMNYQLLGNMVPHLHVHLVPRYLDDPAPGKPLPWEPKPVAQPEYDRQVQLLTDCRLFP